ncbi:aspartyl/glutamyl-tRNA(Asn/Gln) amidotransferasesubunit B [Striga asiatica]|uniref:Aspartyl/glutamyl-tRNA(Asn/Gln) amidotransferasesubunit B n=1 Tax=Striga asiatica TaxID=4170 RepID=A0A5A7PB64_STRAF|nr:aspartyl/glutamyl-tRNA(Asn/Gln) amidotransferasesubunit B [Striga asiatica]
MFTSKINYVTFDFLTILGNMRSIRTCAQPTKIALCRQFQQSQLLRTTGDVRHPVSIETSNIEHGSNIQWFARSYAASASPERLQTKNQRRKISKYERKSMVENFVNRYRNMNAGKFPTVTEVKKDVGGGYYFVRSIIQELAYKSKMSPVAVDKKEASDKIAIEKDKISTNTEEISIAKDLGEGEIISQQPSISLENDESKDVGIQSPNPIDQPTIKQHLDPENGKTVHEDEHKFDWSQSKTELQELQEVSEREAHKAPNEVAERKEQTSMWENLKSFANGIFGMWKRS